MNCAAKMCYDALSLNPKGLIIMKWFVVQARSGYENKVAENIKARITMLGVEDQFGQIVVPSERVVQMRAGQKIAADRKLFPGYVMVQMKTESENGIPRLTSEAWHAVKDTKNVLGFMGGTKDRPLPISDAEAARMLAQYEEGQSKPAAKALFEKGQAVRITEGPFNDFNGVVEEVLADKGHVKVAVMVFGRATVVDFTVNQVEAVL